jgi:hypothetical protein
MPRAEISWKRRTPEGETIRVYAQHFGNQWQFFVRGARYEQRHLLERPPLDDWLELLDAVRRASVRDCCSEEVVPGGFKARDSRTFPDAEL